MVIRVRFAINTGMNGKHHPSGISARFMQSAIDSLSDNLVIVDEKAEIVLVNSAWRRFAHDNGLAHPNSGLGLNYLEICDSARGKCSDEAAFVGSNLRRLLKERKGEFECKYPCHSLSERRWFELGVTCFQDGPNFFVILAHHNVTALMETQEALCKTQEELRSHAQDLEKKVGERTKELNNTISELEAFAYSLSHDLKAPVRAMRGFSDLILRQHGQALPPDGKEYVEHIRKSAEDLDQMIADVLSLSRISRQQLQLGQINVEALVRSVIAQLPELQPPNAQILIEAPLMPVLADPASLRQCVANILCNAVKFVGAGITPFVRIRSQVQAAGDQVRLSFLDNGIGIPAEAHERIFELFYRDPSAEGKTGTGLGLAIVKKAVERMGGCVGVESAVGKGSCFWLELRKAQP